MTLLRYRPLWPWKQYIWFNKIKSSHPQASPFNFFGYSSLFIYRFHWISRSRLISIDQRRLEPIHHRPYYSGRTGEEASRELERIERDGSHIISSRDVFSSNLISRVRSQKTCDKINRRKLRKFWRILWIRNRSYLKPRWAVFRYFKSRFDLTEVRWKTRYRRDPLYFSNGIYLSWFSSNVPVSNYHRKVGGV